jgi:hypothetical protein
MNRSRVLCFGLLLMVCITPGRAQPREPQPLPVILLALEKKFSVAFTYAHTTSGINQKILAPPREADLAQCLRYLQDETGLTFEVINQRYIAIVQAGDQPVDRLCGYLRSAETGEPVAGATIQAGSVYTYSQTDGYFEFSNESSATLTITSLGFEPVQQAVSVGACQSIVLPVARMLLEEVTVSDVITTGMERKSDGSITLQQRALGILPGLPQPDALQALQYVPGVNSILESAAELNIRGGTNDQNLFLIDGIKFYQTGHFFGLISGLNPPLTTRVDLIRNGTGAYYGDGVSGTIAMATENTVSDKPSGSVGLNMLYADGYVHVPLAPNVSLQVSGRYGLPAAWRTPAYKKYFNRAFSDSDLTGNVTQDEDFGFYDVSAKVLYDITPRDKFRVSLFNIANELTYAETGERSGSLVAKESSLMQQSLGGGFTYDRLWSNRVKTTAEGYYSRYTLDAVNQDIAEVQRLTQQNAALETGMKVHALVEFTPHAYVQTGYQFFETGITNADAVDNPAFERRIKDVMRTHAAFVEGNFSWFDARTNLRMGLRGNYYGKVKLVRVEPRVVFTQTIGKDLTAEVMGELKSQTSMQVVDAQRDFLGVEKSRWVMSNGTDVPVMQSRQLSAGISWKRNAWFVQTEAYAKQVMGILSSSQGFQNQFEFVRTEGQYTVTGVDVLINYQQARFTQWARYSLSKNAYDFASFIPPDFPNNTDIRHVVSAGMNYRFSTVEVGAGATWYTGRPTTSLVTGNEVVGGVLQYAQPNGERLPDYFRVDASLRWYCYTRAQVKAQVGLSCWNILNRKNILNAYYVLENDTPRNVQLTGLAITPNIFLRVDF